MKHLKQEGKNICENLNKDEKTFNCNEKVFKLV